MNLPRRSGVAVAACGLMLIASASAQAYDKNSEPPASRLGEQQSYRLSIGPSVGLGIGSPGLGGRLGVGGEYWLGNIIGVGLEGALMGQGAIFGDESSAAVGELVGALRSASRHHYAIFALGVGFAQAKHTFSSGLCLDLFGDGCPDPTIARYGGYAVGVALGWLAHPGDSAFEMGPVGRFDLVADPKGRAPADYIVTLNLALGYAWLR